MNSTDTTVREALRWLRYSGEDLAVASKLTTLDLPALRHICWLSQQAAEKALKAALVYNKIDFRPTHDLDALRNMLPDDWPVRQTHDDLTELTEWAVEARYPGD